jgi:preprotein translocase subunit SecG
MLHSVLLVIHFICAFAIIGLVLLQRGKGAEAGAGFGAGASGTVFGARGATTALSRATAIFAAVFMITSLSLTYVGTHHAAPSSSILEQLSQKPAAPSSLPAGTTPVDAAPAAAPPSASGAPAASSGAAAAAPADANTGASSGAAPPASK